jgi:hypothetical protein
MSKHLLTMVAILTGGSLMAGAPAAPRGLSVLPQLSFLLMGGGSGGGGADDGAGHEANHEAGDDRGGRDGIEDDHDGMHEAGDDNGVDANDLPDDSDPALLLPAVRGKRS